MWDANRAQGELSYQWKLGRWPGCVRVYATQAIPTTMAIKTMVNHADRVMSEITPCQDGRTVREAANEVHQYLVIASEFRAECRWRRRPGWQAIRHG